MSKDEKSLLGMQSLAAAFDGLVCSDPDEVKGFFQDDMANNAIIADEQELGMIRCLPMDTQQLLKRYIFRGYLAGWTRCELEVLAIKAKARTGNE